jgi:hypothetical protein
VATKMATERLQGGNIFPPLAEIGPRPISRPPDRRPNIVLTQLLVVKKLEDSK